MKKYSWLIAIFAVFALVFAGFVSCGGAGAGGGGSRPGGGGPSGNGPSGNGPSGNGPSGNGPSTPSIGDCLSCGKDPCPHNDIWECWADKHGFVPGSGGFGGKFTGDLFINGQFNPVIGTPLLFSFTDDEGTPTSIGELELITSGNPLYSHFPNSLITIGPGSGGMVGVFFEKYIDVTDATVINLIIESGTSNWSGGMLYFHNEDNPSRPLQAQWWGGGGNVNDVLSGINRYIYGLSNFQTLNPGGGASDFTKLVGFALKSNGRMVVPRIEIVAPPPLYTAKVCDCDLHPLNVGSFPFSGERQPRDAADHVALRAAPPNSYLLIYFTNTGDDRRSPGRLGGSSGATHMAGCPCGNAATTGNLPQRWDFPAREDSSQVPNPDYAGGYIQVPIDIIWALMDCQGNGDGHNRWNGEHFNINMYNDTVATGVVLHMPKS